MLRADPRYAYLVRESSATLAERAVHNSLKLALLKQPWFRLIAGIIERATIPGIVLHYALRKDRILRCARESVTAGAKQAVILGAGFDSLGYDLKQKFPALNLWELDHPATQRLKASALRQMQSTELQLIPADLSNTGLVQILSDHPGFCAQQRTLWVAEGLLMYFEETTVSRIFEQTAGTSGAGSRFIFTFMRPDSARRLRFEQQTPLVDWWLKMSGEPFRWGSTPERLAEFIRPWRISQLYDAADLRPGADELSPEAARGEMICVAEL